MQNPTDTDATFRQKAGKNHVGYVGNVVKSLGEDCSIITDFDYQPILQGRYRKSWRAKRKGSYHSNENEEKVAENNIDFIATALTGQAPAKEIANFELSENKEEITKCPLGNAPIKCSHNENNGNYRVVMEKRHCVDCPYKEKCKAKMQKNKKKFDI